MHWLIGILSFIRGGIFGIFFMCLFQINRSHGNEWLDKAEKYTQKALDISSYNFTENSISYARNLNTMGIILDAKGESESALTFTDRYCQYMTQYKMHQKMTERVHITIWQLHISNSKSLGIQ